MTEEFDSVGCVIHICAIAGLLFLLLSIAAIGQVVKDHVRWIP